MIRPITPPGQRAEPPGLATGGPQPAVSILSDLNPGRVRLPSAPRGPAGPWKWGLPLALLVLLGGGFLAVRQAPPPAALPPSTGGRPAPVAATPSPPAPPGRHTPRGRRRDHPRGLAAPTRPGPRANRERAARRRNRPASLRPPGAPGHGRPPPHGPCPPGPGAAGRADHRAAARTAGVGAGCRTGRGHRHRHRQVGPRGR